MARTNSGTTSENTTASTATMKHSDTTMPSGRRAAFSAGWRAFGKKWRSKKRIGTFSTNAMQKPAMNGDTSPARRETTPSAAVGSSSTR